MPDNLSQDPALFGTLGQSLSDAAGLFLGDPLQELLPSLHEGVGESRFAIDINEAGLRTQETGLEAWLKWLRDQQQENGQSGGQYDSVTGINPTPASIPRVNNSASNITGTGEIVNSVSSGEESSSDSASPAPMRLESETMELSGGYGIESKAFASGDALIGLKNRKGSQ